MRKIKIFLTTLAIAGVLFATSSCVDDSESASVTELRGLRADQLRAKAALDNAQAALYNAQAQLESIKVQAEADLKAAQAEYQLAQARYQDSYTELNKAQLKEREANYKYQILLWESQYNQLLVTAEQQLLTVQLAYRNYKTGELTTLLSEYSSFLTAITTSKNNIAKYTIELAKLQLELDTYSADSARFVDNEIISLKSTIRSDSLTIVKNTKKIAEWEAFVIDDDAADKIAENEAKLAVWVDSIPILYKAIAPAQYAYDEATAVSDSLKTLYDKYKTLVETGTYTYVSFGNSPYTSTTEPKYTLTGVTLNHKGSSVPSTAITYSGYHPTLGAVYSRFATYGLYYWYIGTVTEGTLPTGDVDGYISKEDYEHQERTLKEDTAKYAAEEKQLLAQLKTLSPRLTALGNAEYTARVNAETKEKDFNTAYDVWMASTKTAEDTAKYVAAGRAYDGLYPYIAGDSRTGNILENNGGALGVWRDAEAKYQSLYDSIQPLNAKVIEASANLTEAISLLEGYTEAIEILSSGPRAVLYQKWLDAQTDESEKLDLLGDANDAYEAASDTTAYYRSEISTLSKLWGLSINTEDKTVYESQAADVIQNAIDGLQTGINNAQASIENNKRNLANITLYAKDTNSNEAVAIVIDIKKAKIETKKTDIANEEQNIAVYEAQLRLVQEGINAILAEPAGE